MYYFRSRSNWRPPLWIRFISLADCMPKVTILLTHAPTVSQTRKKECLPCHYINLRSEVLFLCQHMYLSFFFPSSIRVFKYRTSCLLDVKYVISYRTSARSQEFVWVGLMKTRLRRLSSFLFSISRDHISYCTTPTTLLGVAC